MSSQNTWWHSHDHSTVCNAFTHFTAIQNLLYSTNHRYKITTYQSDCDSNVTAICMFFNNVLIITRSNLTSIYVLHSPNHHNINTVNFLLYTNKIHWQTWSYKSSKTSCHMGTRKQATHSTWQPVFGLKSMLCIRMNLLNKYKLFSKTERKWLHSILGSF